MGQPHKELVLLLCTPACRLMDVVSRAKRNQDPEQLLQRDLLDELRALPEVRHPNASAAHDYIATGHWLCVCVLCFGVLGQALLKCHCRCRVYAAGTGFCAGVICCSAICTCCCND
jgi:hypothetical protein